MLNAIADWLNGLTGVEMSIHGWISILLTLIGVFGIWLGLFWLLQKSHKSGHDDTVDEYRDPRRK